MFEKIKKLFESMDKELGLKVLARTFAISDVRELELDVDFTQVTKSRVRFVKNTRGCTRSITYSIGRGNYEYALDILKKYGTEEMVDKFIADNKSAFRPSLSTILANTFFIDTDKNALSNYVAKNTGKNAVWYEFEEVEYCGKTYYVAYN
jgi:hypothetical protein